MRNENTLGMPVEWSEFDSALALRIQTQEARQKSLYVSIQLSNRKMLRAPALTSAADWSRKMSYVVVVCKG